MCPVRSVTYVSGRSVNTAHSSASLNTGCCGATWRAAQSRYMRRRSHKPLFLISIPDLSCGGC